MTKRMQKLLLGVAAIAALALGGAVFASAQSSSPRAASESTAGPDTDNVQSGDQTTPDAPATTAARASSRQAKASSRHAKASSRHAKAVTKHTPKAAGAQSSGSTTQEQPGAENATEQPGSEAPETGAETESAPGSDGPGGHADEPGNPNADHQFQGAE